MFIEYFIKTIAVLVAIMFIGLLIYYLYNLHHIDWKNFQLWMNSLNKEYGI